MPEIPDNHGWRWPVLVLRKLEVPVLTLVLGAVPPVVGLLAGWWGSLVWLSSETWIACSALAGLGAGLVVDVIFLKKWVRRRQALSWVAWLGIFLFYSVGVFGFCMGVPVFNVALALPVGLVVGGKLALLARDADRDRRIVRRACLCTTAMLAVICAASATIALLSRSTATDLQRMLHLGFVVTPAHIVGLSVVGGAALLTLQWVLTERIARWTLRGWQILPTDR